MGGQGEIAGRVERRARQSEEGALMSWRIMAMVTALLVPTMIVSGVAPRPAFSAPASAVWSPAGHMAVARAYQTATLLPGGDVLVAGGANGQTAYASAEVYDPRTGHWGRVGSMSAARFGHAAVLLGDGRVLVAGGINARAVLASAELYNPRTGRWSSTGHMLAPRFNETATVLTDGDVLVTGGENATHFALASAELYNPRTGHWSATGPMSAPRNGHSATLLANGEVLVEGGSSGGLSAPVLASAELYNPRTGRWSRTGAMHVARDGQTASLLLNGEVLVAGGTSGQSASSAALTSAELYDPRSGIWTMTAPMALGRLNHTATTLSDGRVLVAGGQGESLTGLALDSAELYDPRSGTWTFGGTLVTPRGAHTATLLPDGRVLLVGGVSGAFLSNSTASAELSAAGIPGDLSSTVALGRAQLALSVLPSGHVLASGGLYELSPVQARSSTELFDPATGAWSEGATMSEARASFAATTLPNGKVLVAGGVGSDSTILSTAELYNPLTGTWTATGNMTAARASPAAALLPGGRVLVAGGVGASATIRGSAETYDPASGRWSRTGSLLTPRAGAAAISLANGRVLVVGGAGGRTGSALASAELYNPATRHWSRAGTMASARSQLMAARLADGRVLVAGGVGSLGLVLTSAELYDPATGRWTETGPMTTPRADATATLLGNGDVLVAGGAGGPSNVLASAELYNPATGRWTKTGSMVIARANHAATLLSSGDVLVAGGLTTSPRVGVTSGAEVYDPKTGIWTRVANM